MGNAADIQPPGCHISSYQNIDSIFLKLTDNTVSLCLRQIPVNAFCGIPALLQRFGHFIGTSLGSDKYNSQFRRLHIQKSAQRIKLLPVRNFQILLFYQINSNGSRFNLN